MAEDLQPATLLSCPVRGCGRPLAELGAALACGLGHRFDRARSGYVNLLQPQDRRSRQPGDSKQAALARRRLYQGGHAAPLLAALLEAPELRAFPAGATVLDVGCGEGWMLSRLASLRGWSGYGVDLSAPAIELAAKLAPGASWVVANADRRLPCADTSFDLVVSLTARLPAGELRRVLKPLGLLVVAVAGPDDLAELRQAVLGEASERQRFERVERQLAMDFELSRRQTVRWSEQLSCQELSDLLASTYRGARHSQRLKSESLAAQTVTMSRELGWFRPRHLPATG